MQKHDELIDFLRETISLLDPLLPSPPNHMQCWCGKNGDIHCSGHHSGPDACRRDSGHQWNSAEDEDKENVHGSNSGTHAFTQLQCVLTLTLI